MMTKDGDLPTFPPGFVWGASTSAYQIEGAVDRGWTGAQYLGYPMPDEGRGRPTAVHGDVACDHYHR